MPQDKLTAVRIKQENGEYGPQIPVAAKAENVEYNEEYSVKEVLGDINVNKGPLQEQIENIDTSTIQAALEARLDEWEEQAQIPVASVAVDSYLINQGQAADAKQAGKVVTINNEANGNATKLHLNTSNDIVNIALMDDLDTRINRPIKNGQYDNGEQGQLLRTKGDGSTEWVDEGLPKDEQVQEVVNAWMDQHSGQYVIPDGNITENKLNDELKLQTIKDYVTPEMFGAIGDGIADDRQAIINAFTNAYLTSKVIYFPNKTYFSSDEIIIENVPDSVLMDGEIYFSNGNGITFGSSSNVMWYKKICVRVRCDIQDGSVNYFGLKIINAVDCDIDIWRINGFCTGAILIGDSNAFAYNTFHINYIRSVLNSLSILRANGGYNNENLFIGGRFIEKDTNAGIGVYVSGNNHVFIKPSIEHAYKCFVFSTGSRNTVIACRSENSTYVAEFDSDSQLNEIDIGYGITDYLDTRGKNIVKSNVIEGDIGVNSDIAKSFNNIIYDSGNLIEKIDISGDSLANITSPLYALTTNGEYKRAPGLNNFAISGNEIQLTGTSRVIGVFVDCTISKNFLIQQGGSKCGRVLVKLYDSSGNLLDMSNINIGTGSEYNTSYGTAILGEDRQASYVIFPTEAKKAFIGIRGSSAPVSLFSFMIKSRLMSTIISDGNPEQ